MAFRPKRWLERRLRQRACDDWARLDSQAERLRAAQLPYLREQALTLRKHLDSFLTVSHQRVRGSRAALDRLPMPGGTDWRWRPGFLDAPMTPAGSVGPDSGTLLGPGLTVWHDCPDRALLLRQTGNTDSADLSSQILRIEVLGFGGSFLSLSTDLPDEVRDGLTRDHIIRVETVIQPEAEADIYLRLNIGNGPNTEEILRHLGGMEAGRGNRHVTEFDLAETAMNENRIDKVWLDVILEKPAMNAVGIREMIVSRHPRANV
ncbi:hypothetical protein CYR75_08565 [Paracoccus jeotgali]|uniref:Uncharacterized protein n=1 Tax=Paracoccus jeotgali TaxID=2065379 RepID=A0A2K9MH37_9RHOB|nr:hypothetical protein CYR75_08565 [Paracoccus jeotgali]